MVVTLIGSAAGQMIPPDRRFTWQGNVGVPGGIPSVTTRCTTSACNTLSGGTVTTASINAAVSSAPIGTYVSIPSGTHTLSGTINMKNGIVLRGAGTDSTILNAGGFSQNIIAFPQSAYFGTTGTISGGYTKGSTSLALSTASGLSAGDVLVVYEDNDSDIVWVSQADTNDPTALRQYVRITGVVGSTVTITPPMVFTYKASLNPSFKQVLGMSSAIGLEEVTIDGQTQGGRASNISIDSCNSCWIKNVTSKNCMNQHVLLTRTLFNEIRGCYFSGKTSANVSDVEGHGVYANQAAVGYLGANTSLLVEDNIFRGLWASVMLNNATASVVSYNYSWDNHGQGVETASYIIQHGAHGLMNLWEGNIGQGIQNDGYHGSGSHDTIFRNYFHGVGVTYNTIRKPIDLARYSYYHNVVGNVLGHSSWTAAAYEMTGSPPTASNYIYRLGYPLMGSNSYTSGNAPYGTGSNPNDGSAGLDAKVRTTLLRHMNYDYFNSRIKYCSDPDEPGCQGGDGSTVLPNSLYLSSKPAWWGTNRRWPTIGPDLNPMVGVIPARARFLAPKNLRR